LGLILSSHHVSSIKTKFVHANSGVSQCWEAIPICLTDALTVQLKATSSREKPTNLLLCFIKF